MSAPASPDQQRRLTRRMLYCVGGFALLTVAAAILVWVFAPLPMTIAVMIDLPPGGAEVFVTGRSMGSAEPRLIDDDLFSVCGHPSPTTEWPPPGAGILGFNAGWKVLAEQCIVPPTDPSGDYIWHFKLTNAGHEMRLELPIRAVDIHGNPLFLHYEPGSQFWPWAGKIGARLNFEPLP